MHAIFTRLTTGPRAYLLLHVRIDACTLAFGVPCCIPALLLSFSLDLPRLLLCDLLHLSYSNSCNCFAVLQM